MKYRHFTQFKQQNEKLVVCKTRLLMFGMAPALPENALVPDGYISHTAVSRESIKKFYN